MMISPESYYEEYLKGKTKEEIGRRIRRLKQEIGHLKRIIESAAYEEPEWDYKPGPDTRIACDYEYLDCAIRAFEEAGGTYIPSKAESLKKEFDERLRYLQKFGLITSSTGTEFEYYYVEMRNGNPWFKYTNSNMIGDEIVYDELTEAPFDADSFFAMVRKTRMGTWKKRTIVKDRKDGWKINMIFSDREKEQTLIGIGYYPWSYNYLVDFFEEAKQDMNSL